MKDAAILARNKDVEHIVNAATYTGVYGRGAAMPKRFGLLVTTDVHRCVKHMQGALDYLDSMDALDCGICLGDIQGGNYTETDASWYYMAVNACRKPFYTVIGNHDGGNSADKAISATKEQVLEKYIRTTRGKIGLPNIDKTYYAVNWDQYKLTLIVLDNYMAPEDRDADGNFQYSRGLECLDQEEVDWLVHTLSQVPEDYQVIVARHGFPDSAVKLDANGWTQKELGGTGTEASPYGQCELVPDVINAWIHGESLTGRYAPLEGYEGFPTLTVNADFSRRGQGVFVAYLIGHVHADIVGTSAKYPNQHAIWFAATASDDWQNYGCSDLPRARGTKAEDCITVFSVDTEKRRIHLVRVGSNITFDLRERTYTTIAY